MTGERQTNKDSGRQILIQHLLDTRAVCSVLCDLLQGPWSQWRKERAPWAGC